MSDCMGNRVIPSTECNGDPPWLREARFLLDSGSPLDMHCEAVPYRVISLLDRHLHIGAPWCGIFVAHCLRKTMPAVTIPARHMRARPWARWGYPTWPRYGAVTVLWHYHPRSPFGHVGFCLAEDEDEIDVLGGNQRDRIAIGRYPKNRVLACRWPWPDRSGN